MIGRSNKASEGKKPRDSLNASTIQKYLKETQAKSPIMDNKQQCVKDKKKDPTKNKGASGGTPRGAISPGPELDLSIEANMEALPTKIEMQDMLTKLENILKAEILNIREDLGHLLKRVEIVEEITEQQTLAIEDLKKQVKNLQTGQQELLLKLEDHRTRGGGPRRFFV